MSSLRAVARVLGCLSIAVSGPVTAVQAQAPRSDTAEVQTAATARRSVRPDLAFLTLQFAVEDSTPSRAGKRLALRADSVRRALAAVGIPRDSLVTGSRWYWWPERLQVVPHQLCVPVPDPRRGCEQVFDTTYRVREVIEVRIGDLNRVGAVIDVALALRITDISGIQFIATNVRSAQAEAYREATTHVREQAEIIASAGGGRLGRVLSLSTEPDYSERYSGVEGIVARAAADGGARTEITAPSVNVTVTVPGRWQLLGR